MLRRCMFALLILVAAPVWAAGDSSWFYRNTDIAPDPAGPIDATVTVRVASAGEVGAKSWSNSARSVYVPAARLSNL